MPHVRVAWAMCQAGIRLRDRSARTRTGPSQAGFVRDQGGDPPQTPKSRASRVDGGPRTGEDTYGVSAKRSTRTPLWVILNRRRPAASRRGWHKRLRGSAVARGWRYLFPSPVRITSHNVLGAQAPRGWTRTGIGYALGSGQGNTDLRQEPPLSSATRVVLASLFASALGIVG